MGFQMPSSYFGHSNPMALTNPEGGVGEMPLTTQKSIYSLTLEEFQNTLEEPSTSFGSMNMEELLKNIWTVEEGQAMVAAMGTVGGPTGRISKQASLQRQEGSLSLQGDLGQKSVDEVWKTVCQGNVGTGVESGLPAKQRELTFSEMTLEDFLLKAGIVKEEDTGASTGQALLSFGRNVVGGDQNGANQFGASVLPSSRSVLAGLFVDRVLQSTATQVSFPPGNSFVDRVLQSTATQVSFPPGNSFGGSYHNPGLQQSELFQQPQTVKIEAVLPNSGKQACNGITGPVGLGGQGFPMSASINTGVSYGFNNGLSLAVPPTYNADSPPSQSSDGAGTSYGNMPLSPILQSGINGSVLTRKRLAEGLAEMAVIKRQRRMIKNRESAVRSRDRKQAYTVELENELTQLRAENSRLKQKQEKAERKMKKVIATPQEFEKEKKALRRTQTGPW